MRSRCLLRVLASLAVSVAVPAEARQIEAVATFSILGDLVRDIAGDLAEVRVLVGPGGDIHGYEPTPHDAAAVATADLVFANGLGLEGWLDRLSATKQPGQVVVVSAGILPLRRDGAIDPHAWQDVGNASRYLRTIAAALARADPADAAIIQSRLDATLLRLGALDQSIRDRIAAIPPARRVVVTSHDAFDYFGRAYGVTFLAAAGFTEDSEPSAAAIAALIAQIRRQHISAVFVENTTDPRLVQEIAADTGVKLGGTLFTDALSAPGGDGATYEAMMRHNVDLLVSAMAGQ